MRMEFGMPTLIEEAGLERCAALCSNLGLDFVELNMNMPQYQLDALDEKQAAEIAAEYGIYYTLHLDENLNVADFNPYIAEGYRRTVMESIELAKRLHMPILNMHMHSGVYFTLPEKRVYLFEVYRERYLRDMRIFRDACERAIGDSGITLCVENCDGFTGYQQEAIDLLLESPVFALTFDVGHNHSCGGKDEPFVLAHGAHLRHMHLHDALGKKNHLALGSGEMDINGRLRLAEEHDCRVVLETKTIAGLGVSEHWMKENGWMTR